MISYQKLPRWVKIGLTFPLVFLNGWLAVILYQSLEPISSIVIAACLITFLLYYPITLLEQRGLQRAWAIASVLVLAIVLVSVLSLWLLPIVFQQLEEFSDRLPAWLEEVQQQVASLDKIPIFQSIPVDLNHLTAELTSQVSQTLQLASSQIIILSFDIVNSALNLLLILTLTIFLVFSGKPLWRGLLNWLPTPWNAQVPDSLSQSFEAYFGGQAIIATIQSVALMTVFLLLQIPFGLLFGLVIGLASLFPFGGSLSIALISSLLAVQNIWLGLKVLLVAIAAGQIIENVIAPRLIGGMTGLNPAVVFISLLTGAKVGGILGILLAVPIAGFIKRMTDNLSSADTEALVVMSPTKQVEAE